MKKKYLFILTAVYLAIYFGLTSTNLEVKPFDYEKLQTSFSKDQLVQLLSGYLKLKTIRSDEVIAVNYFRKILKDNDIESSVIEIPGHANRPILLAELGDNKDERKGVILAGHADVVEAKAEDWNSDPFGAQVREGRIYGRGAIDMKSLSILHLAAFIDLKKSNKIINRKIMLLLVPGEEDGGLGAQYLVENKPELFSDYNYMINEGAMFSKGIVSDDLILSNIQFAEKGVFWFMAKTSALPGHGSAPAKDYAAKKLLKFIRQVEVEFSERIVSTPVQRMLHQVAKKISGIKAFILKRTQNLVIQKILASTFENSRLLNAMTKNTVSITGLETEKSLGMNVISATAQAKIDMRILPGFTVEEIHDRVKKIAADHEVDILVIQKNDSSVSVVDNEFFNSMAHISQDNVAGSIASPLMSYGATDCFHFRKLSLNCYGFFPVVVDSKDIATMHGIDENLSIDNLLNGANIMASLVKYWAIDSAFK